MWREQAIIEWSWRVNSVVACCHSVKLCAHATRDFRSQQNGAVTRMWRSCGVQPSHKKRAIGAVHWKKKGMLLQPLRCRCVKCVIHHERDVHEEQHMYVARTGNNRLIMSLRTSRSGFPIASSSKKPGICSSRSRYYVKEIFDSCLCFSENYNCSQTSPRFSSLGGSFSRSFRWCQSCKVHEEILRMKQWSKVACARSMEQNCELESSNHRDIRL